jgi:mannitol 2-dehydrogenase
VPATAFGFVTEALARRRAAGIEPFTVMSCDNIAGNGEVAHKMIGAFARLKDAELADWIEEHVSFPNCMVDRITPVTTDHDRELIAERFGIEDGWPVVCEPFTQWALEDKFPAGRPPYDEVGVQLVPDVTPYELMKLRLLNASHQGLCYLGYLAGYRYAHEVCSDPLFTGFLLGYMNDEAGVQLVPDVTPYELMKLRLLNASHQALCYLGYLSGYRYAHEVCRDELFTGFLLGYMDEEATPTLEPVPGVDLDAYKHQLIERFANPEIKDTLARLCAESSDRIPKWLVPVIRTELAAGGPVRRSALVVAAWARYAEGVDEQGEDIEVVDRRKEQLMRRAQQQPPHGDDPLAFLRDPDLFGDLADDERFTREYTKALEALHADGARTTLERWEGKA